MLSLAFRRGRGRHHHDDDFIVMRAIRFSSRVVGLAKHGRAAADVAVLSRLLAANRRLCQ